MREEQRVCQGEVVFVAEIDGRSLSGQGMCHGFPVLR